MGFNKIVAVSMTELFVQQIENMILSGELTIGEQLKCKTDQTYLYRFGLFCHKIRTEKDSEKAGAVGKNGRQQDGHFRGACGA